MSLDGAKDRQQSLHLPIKVGTLCYLFSRGKTTDKLFELYCKTVFLFSVLFLSNFSPAVYRIRCVSWHDIEHHVVVMMLIIMMMIIMMTMMIIVIIIYYYSATWFNFDLCFGLFLPATRGMWEREPHLWSLRWMQTTCRFRWHEMVEDLSVEPCAMFVLMPRPWRDLEEVDVFFDNKFRCVLWKTMKKEL